MDRFLGNAPRDPQWLLDVVFAVASVALIAWCLLLTKSRTAVLGTACGSAVLVVGRRLPSLRFGHAITPWFRRTVVFIGGGGVLFAIAIGVLLQSGGLDREVLSEAPKSVSYRLQYWRATAQLVAAHPWLGVGPGNFRPHYLKYKLPEASEEIADPHNLFFDVAATGGLVSLMGLVLLLVMPVCGRAPCDHELASVSATSSDSRWPFWCAGAAPLLAFTGLMTLNGEWDDRLLVLSCGWFCVSGVRSWLAAGVTSESRDVAHWAFAAAVALVVHLLGAGGISMPAVSQLLLGLIAFSLSPRSIPGAANVETLSSGAASALRLFENGLTPQNRGADAAPPGSLIKPRVRLTSWLRAGALMGWAVTVTVFFATALVPVTRCQSWLAIGNRLALARDGRSGAEAAYRAACLADEWSSRPWHRRAELTYEQAARDRFRSNELFEAAVKLLLDSMTRDPHNFQGPRTLGNWWLARWQVTQNDHDARQAFEWLGRASDSYPTNASLLAELSQAATAASQPADAASAAQGALKQNELNRRLGHVDRYLAEEVVARLQRLVETARSP